ncbi:spore germination protein [Dethiobacter alkaliphilus]|uniref:spore germination protein n=1 Tax=Dethiobacter alkaliphilus TaxID=427926 RepID=UPI00222627EB|nr:spore germination protein [Dethiobacter alkaliphilus]MCW3489297.1 spore germination protein [Dethiobacter alkaliphilus]
MVNALSFLRKLKKLKKAIAKDVEAQPEQRGTKLRAKDSAHLKMRMELIQQRLGESNDVVIRQITSSNHRLDFAVVFIDGLSDKKMIHDHIIRPIQSDNVVSRYSQELTLNNALDLLQSHITSSSEVMVVGTLNEAIKFVLNGDTALLIDGEEKILIYGTREWQMRAVDEPETESAVRGPREGFTETLRVNTSLLRRRIRHENLRLETMLAGRRTGTEIILAYINDIANPQTLDEVRKRVAAIDTDSILESGYIEEFIEDVPLSIFPQIEHTERVDKAASAILDGRILIMVDNTPHALIVPTTFFQFLQASEDYYERPYVGLALRILRLFVLNIALMLPALYVAIVTFHQEMLPTPLLLSILAARAGIPFPAVAEALIMEAMFEVLREAGVRLPKTVGQAVSIVGGLVIGDAAIRAGIVSPAMVIVVATTAISTFAIPAFNASITLRILRFPLIVLGGIMGLYGVIFGLLIILIHLAGLQSFGVPYLSPLVHGTLPDMAKTFARPFWWMTGKRPHELKPQDTTRQANNMFMRKPPADERELTHEDTEEDNAGKR